MHDFPLRTRWGPEFSTRWGSAAGVFLCVIALSACAGRTKSAPAALGAVEKPHPAFAGTAVRANPAAECRNLVPLDLAHPFSPAGEHLTIKDYQVVDCWDGLLAGKKFQLGTYFSPSIGAGLAIRYNGALVAHLQAGSGAPTVVRFSGDDVCVAEKAGAFFIAANLRTGAQMDERRAQDFCPPASWPPSYVIGLGRERPPVR